MPFSVTGAVSELLLLVGILLAVFMGWKYWVQPGLYADLQTSTALDIVTNIGDNPVGEIANPDGDVPVRDITQGDTPGEQFGVIYIPAFGDWVRPLTTDVLHSDLTNSLGHYGNTQSPGEVGNFSLAGHRTGWGDPLYALPDLPVGSEIIVETADGWYVYQFRNGQYVPNTAVELLNPVPLTELTPEQTGNERYITLQTCNPIHAGGPEFYLGIGTLAEFVPRAEGAPEAVTEILSNLE